MADQWLSTGTHVQVCWFPSSIKLTTAEINPHNSNPLNNLKFVRWCCSIQVFILYMVIIFIRPSLRQDVLWYTNVRLSVRPFHMSRSNLRSPWPIHFKLRIVIGIDTLWSVYFLVKFQFFIPELWDFIHQIVGDFSYVAL